MSENKIENDPALECAICKRSWRKSELLSQGVCPGCHQVDDGVVEDVVEESEETR